MPGTRHASRSLNRHRGAGGRLRPRIRDHEFVQELLIAVNPDEDSRLPLLLLRIPQPADSPPKTRQPFGGRCRAATTGSTSTGSSSARPDPAGGGISRKADKCLPLLTNRTPVVAAALQNTAGIVGAAVAAQVDRAESARSGRSECTLSLQWSKAAAGPDSGEYP